MNDLYSYLSVNDLPPLQLMREEAYRLKKNPFLHTLVGKYQTLGLLTFEEDLHTQLTLQKAAHHLGMNFLKIDIRIEGKKLIVGYDGTTYKTENLRETAETIGAYCEVLALYSPAQWKSKYPEFGEEVLLYLQDFANVPLLNIESPQHKPVEALANWLTIEEAKKKEKIKVALTWIPSKQINTAAQANSLVHLLKQIPEINLSLAHPPNHRLTDTFATGIKSNYQQTKSLEDADFVIALNWSSTKNPQQIDCKDTNWQLTAEKMNLTQRAQLLHCQPAQEGLGLEKGLLHRPYSLFKAQAPNRVLATQLILKEMLVAGRITG